MSFNFDGAIHGNNYHPSSFPAPFFHLISGLFPPNLGGYFVERDLHHLARFLNGYLIEKIGQGIIYVDLMDR